MTGLPASTAVASTSTAAPRSRHVHERRPRSMYRFDATRRKPGGHLPTSTRSADQEVVCVASGKTHPPSSAVRVQTLLTTGALERADTHVCDPRSVSDDR